MFTDIIKNQCEKWYVSVANLQGRNLRTSLSKRAKRPQIT